MGRYRWFVGLFVIALLVIVSVYAYNAGVAQGLVQSGKLGTAPGAVVPVLGWYPRPWGFGFFPVFPLFFFLLFWVFVSRSLLWRGYGHGRRYTAEDVPRMFEEWHRRAHEKQGSASASGKV
jgi:hypothetical protein